MLFLLNELKVDLLSRFYSFDETEIKRFINKINFGRYAFMNNQNIIWNDELIYFLKDRIDWSALFKLKSLAIDGHFLNKYKNYIDYKSLGACSVMFDGEFNAEILDHIQWSDRGYASLVRSNPEIQDKILTRYESIINWENVSSFFILDETKLDKYRSLLNWKKVSGNNTLKVTPEFFRRYIDLFDKSTISRNPAFSDLIKKHPNITHFDWDYVVLNTGFKFEEDIKFVYKNFKRYHKENKNWELYKNKTTHRFNKYDESTWIKRRFVTKWLCRISHDASKILTDKSMDFVDWSTFSNMSFVKLPVNVIDSFKEKIDFNARNFIVNNSENIPELFITENLNRFKIKSSEFARLRLSNELIDMYSDEINWNSLSSNKYFNWTEDFIVSNQHRLNFHLLSKNPKVYEHLNLSLNDL